jgi:methyltransferase-like protein/cyclopropane fatty-acyl-phospholipid synthase-like methyltransferase
MSAVTPTSYDELPYSRNPFAATHPDCLATVGLLHGMNPAPVTRCRVLELGCAMGGNLIPMAASLPDCSFVGIDLSPRQIAEGQETVAALGLRNIDLKTLSILDLEKEFGEFDYIICHGVYSWVPPAVQDKVLAVCSANLAPQGVAYVSYNTYPGWHLRGVVREMLGFHVGQFTEAPMRVQQARAFLDFLVESVRDPQSVYGQLLKQEADMLGSASDTYLFHEHLEEVNSPLYFSQFVARAGAHRLQYVGEAQPSALSGDQPPKVRSILSQIASNRIGREQYIDFLCCRTFRRTLLCHADVTLAPEPRWQAVQGFRATSRVKPVNPEPDIVSASVEEFRTSSGASLSTNRPLVKAALLTLFKAWPRALAFDDLWGKGQALLREAGDPPQQLADVLLHCYLAHLLELHVHETPFVLEVSDRPLASAVARLGALSEEKVTNLRHHSVELDDLERLLLRHLDGSRDRAALQQLLAAAVAEGVLEIQGNDGQAPSAEQVQEVLRGALEPTLQHLAASALLTR